MFVFGNFFFDDANLHMDVLGGLTTVDIQDIYDASVEWASEPANMVNDVPVTGGGKFALNDPPTKFTGLVVRMDTVAAPVAGNWKVHFAAAPGPALERRTINGGDFIAQGAGDPVANSANIMPVVELSTSPTLVVTGGLTEADKNDIAGRVWDRLLSSHNVAGSFGLFVQKKLLTVTKFLGLK